jgi:hypothetical protein
MRRHALVFPDPAGSVDMVKQEMSAGTWYRSPRPQFLSILLKQMLDAAQNGQDLTFSSWRQSFGFCDPANYTLPAGGNFQVYLFAPMGPPFESDNYGCAVFHNSRRPPTDGGRFIFTGDGLKHQLEHIFSTEFIDQFRQLGGRPRTEVFVRHRLRMCDVAEGVHPIPRILSETIGLSPDEARAKVTAMRQPTSVAEALRIKAEDRRKREREADLEEEAAFAERRQAWLAEHAVREYADALSGTYTANQENAAPAAVKEVAAPEESQPAPAPAPQDAAPAQKVMTRDDIRNARNRRTKMAKATRSKVAADKADAIAAKAHAEKVVARMEREGRP